MKYNVEMLEGRRERKSIRLNCFHKERKDKENARHGAASENERNPDCSSKQILTKGSLCYW